MLIRSRAKKIVHTHNCPFARRIQKSNLVFSYTFDSAMKHDYKLCSYCSPVARKYREEKKAINDYLQDKNLTVYLKDGMLYITDCMKTWFITCSSDKKWPLLVYHENNVGTSPADPDKNWFKGYHFQKKWRYTAILDIIKEIYKHQNSYFNVYKTFEKDIPYSPSQRLKKRARKDKEKKKAKEILKHRKAMKVKNLIVALQNGSSLEALISYPY